MFPHDAEKAFKLSNYLNLPLSSPNLEQLKNNAYDVIVYCTPLKITDGFYTHAWPNYLNISVNSSTFTVEPPQLNHVRRDIPFKLTNCLRIDNLNTIRINAKNVDLLACSSAYFLSFLPVFKGNY